MDTRTIDLEMEILCTIPMAPASMPLKLIVEDFHMESQKSLRILLGNLGLRFPGVRVLNDKDGGGRVVQISPEHWNEICEAGNEYWEKAHG